jgi:hypothetical protein
MMIPTARSITLPFMMKALNSFSIPRFPYFSALWRVFCPRFDADEEIMSHLDRNNHGEFCA